MSRSLPQGQVISDTVEEGIEKEQQIYFTENVQQMPNPGAAKEIANGRVQTTVQKDVVMEAETSLVQRVGNSMTENSGFTTENGMQTYKVDSVKDTEPTDPINEEH